MTDIIIRETEKLVANTTIINKLSYSILTSPLFRTILFFIFEAPLLTLYLQGPSLFGYGFWEGKPFNEICAHLTGINASYWSESRNDGECIALIERKFNAFLVFGYFCMYIAFILALLVACVRRCAIKNKKV